MWGEILGGSTQNPPEWTPEVAGSTRLAWSQAAPTHTVYHCPVALLGSAPTRRDSSWEKLLTSYPLSTAAQINLSGGLLGEKQLLYSAQIPGPTMKGERSDEHGKLG